MTNLEARPNPIFWQALGDYMRARLVEQVTATITLPDGYNGHTVECYTEPLEVNGNSVKLRVVGSEYLIKWCSIDKLQGK